MPKKNKYDAGKWSQTPLYKVFVAMHDRCNPNSKNSLKGKNKRYWERGIIVESIWNKFPPFLTWAFANGYTEGQTIDRKNNDGNYGPDNCKWSTTKQQARNTCRSIRIEVDGVQQNAITVIEAHGITEVHQVNRIKRRLQEGWELSSAIDTPFRRRGNPSNNVDRYRDMYFNLITEIPFKNFYDRMLKGWSLEQAAHVPLRKSKDFFNTYRQRPRQKRSKWRLFEYRGTEYQLGQLYNLLKTEGRIEVERTTWNRRVQIGWDIDEACETLKLRG